MKIQSDFLKNSAYAEDMNSEPMFRGTVSIQDTVYDGELFRKIQYGKEVMVLCLKQDKDEAPF